MAHYSNAKSKSIKNRNNRANIVNKQDCYYYYYSTCSKGDACNFRHEPSARGNETMCVQWLKGQCIRPRCNFRHLELNKKRDTIQCFHETQPGGCLKEHCPFLHVDKENKEGVQSARAPKSIPNVDRSIKNRIPDAIPTLKHPKFHMAKAVDKESINSWRNPKKVRITSFTLAEALSTYDEFSTTLLTLYEDLNFDPIVSKKFAADNRNVFSVDGETVSLRPFMKICNYYLSEEGCDSFVASTLPCQHLHLCREFVVGNCLNATCDYGHSIDTNHNKVVLDIFKLSLIPVDVIEKLFKSVVFKENLKKDSLKICIAYNTGTCQTSDCKSLHICLKYMAELCDEKKVKCNLNHNVAEKSILDILKRYEIDLNATADNIHRALLSFPLIKKRVDELISEEEAARKNVMHTIWAHDYEGNTQVDEICYNSVESFCPNESSGCSRLHGKYHFHWQILSTLKDEDYWVNLPYYQAFALEKAFCDPSVIQITLPPLDTAILPASCRNFISLLKGKSKWTADFGSMKLSLTGEKDLKLRRLCTESNSNPVPEPCIFAWYFLDKNNQWIEYGCVDSTQSEDVKVNVNSSSIEKHFKHTPNTPLIFSSKSFSYTLDFSKMYQKNVKTQVSRAVRRRPKSRLKVNQKQGQDLPDYWDIMQSGERVKRVKLLSSSEEYKKIVQLVQQKGGNFNITNIERVQNPYFYRAFQNKVEEMKALYSIESKVDIQQLFHGTNPDIVPKICEENFDWRLHGSNVGQAYGRGTYFSPLATTSYGYTRADANSYKYMFVAKVAIGTITLGNSNMARPPINPQTNKPFDSTVDNQSSPTIIVKYDKQEYFPEYILTMT